MTREMNKPEFEITYRFKETPDFRERKYRDIAEYCWGFFDEKPKERKLDDWIKPYFDNCCRMEKIK